MRGTVVVQKWLEKLSNIILIDFTNCTGYPNIVPFAQTITDYFYEMN